MQPRTKRQKDVLDYIKQYIERHGYEPSYQQIARSLGVSSKAGIAKHIEALENQGLVSRVRENGVFRLEVSPIKSILDIICEIEWLDVLKDENQTEDWESTPLYVPRFLIGNNSPEKIQAFRVMDDSMSNEHIDEGDIALIKTRSFARDGDIVAALVERRKIVLMRFFRAGANTELHPSNEKFEPTILPADKVEIKGIYRGLLRPFS